MQKIAAIDIGSNTVRLLIMEISANGDFREIDSARVICRLGEGLHNEKRLLESRMALTLQTLQNFRDRCREHGDIAIHAVATSAVRESSNGEEFVRRAREQAGLTVAVIPWEEEARLTLAGVFWKLPHQGRNILTFDIGGGSTEFILSQGKNVTATAGTSLGVVRLTERFIRQHPTDANEYRALTTHLQAELATVKSQLGNPQPEAVIGTAGTVTTLAALDRNIFPYDPAAIHGTELPRKNIEILLEDLKSRSLAERLQLQPLERGREDLIIAGAALVLATLNAFQCDLLTVCEYSLREGILLKAFAAGSPAEPTTDSPKR